MVATMAGSLELRKAEMMGSRTVDVKVGRRDVSLVDGKVVRTVLMSVVEWVDWKDDWKVERLAGRSVESKVLWSEILTAVRMALEKAEKMGMLSAVSSDSMMVDLKVVK
jgi:hypothetical protein